MRSILGGGDGSNPFGNGLFRTLLFTFIVILPLVIFTGYFLFFSMTTLHTVQAEINENHVYKAAEAIADLDVVEQNPALRSQYFQVLLETDVLELRQQRARSALMTRSWMEFMCLISGFILITIGSTFVLARIRGDGANELAAEAADIKASFKTNAPGVMLALVGAILVSLPVLGFGRSIDIKDGSTYFVPIAPTGLPSAASIDKIEGSRNSDEQSTAEKEADALDRAFREFYEDRNN